MPTLCQPYLLGKEYLEGLDLNKRQIVAMEQIDASFFMCYSLYKFMF